MNNKGFMMAEVIVVSAVILMALTGLYVSYNKIYQVYTQRIDYYDVTTLYRLGYYRDILVFENDSEDVFFSENDIVDLSSKVSALENEKIYMIDKDSLANFHDDSLKFNDYVAYLGDSISIDSDYLLVMERCPSFPDVDHCKYAYLEFYEGAIGEDNV